MAAPLRPSTEKSFARRSWKARKISPPAQRLCADACALLSTAVMSSAPTVTAIRLDDRLRCRCERGGEMARDRAISDEAVRLLDGELTLVAPSFCSPRQRLSVYSKPRLPKARRDGEPRDRLTK